MHPTQDDTPVTGRFATFATEAAPTSPRYEAIAEAMAREPDAAAILAHAPLPQRRATLLFAAVHDLVLRGRAPRLAAWYPTAGGAVEPDDGLVAAFLDVLADHRDAIVARLEHRATQTNEPGRTVAMRAGLAWLAAGGDRPLALVEVGTSAGLLLHLDRYRHELVPVDPEARCELRSDDDLPAVADAAEGSAVQRWRTGVVGQAPPMVLPPVARRIGIDAAPLDVADADDRAWLRACVWPEHTDRLARLDAALALATEHDDVELVTGDLQHRLAPTVAAIAPEMQVVVLHSATLAYLSPPQRAAFESTLEQLGRDRPVWRLGLEGHFLTPFDRLARERLGPPPNDEPGFLIAASRFDGDRRDDAVLGRLQSHGRWLAFDPPSRATFGPVDDV
ncbi:MAG: DUF2332 domain-containing protein [Nitriliruptoraceae bacterium]|nr:DUF2332 domain-containing protein [Nitriliruptoraceae bacterium]